jgi:3',5'-cyclic AMP phosphodiesterase CpdA
MLIAQISDPHILEPGRLMEERVDTAAGLRLAIDRVMTMRPRPDLILLTGDLVNDGLEEQYRHLAAILEGCDVEMAAVVGNHDDRGLLVTHLAGCLPSGLADGPLQYVRDVEVDGSPAAIVVLDTVVAGEHSGRLDDERLGWLSEVLDRHRDRPVLVVQHHPPFASGIGFMDAYGLEGADRELDLIAGHPDVVAVLCGHLHRHATAALGHSTAITAPSTAAQVACDLGGGGTAYTGEPGAFLLHRWGATGLTTHVVPIADSDLWRPSWAM